MYGGDDQKGTIMGVFRSLGALARALGPMVASTGRVQYMCSIYCLTITIGLKSLFDISRGNREALAKFIRKTVLDI